jgi:hypothetical protein
MGRRPVFRGHPDRPSRRTGSTKTEEKFHMNAAQRANWEQIKAKGFWHFVLLYFVVFVGGSGIIGLTLYDYFFSRTGFSLEKLMINSVSALIAAFVFGTLLWFINERRYRTSRSGD